MRNRSAPTFVELLITISALVLIVASLMRGCLVEDNVAIHTAEVSGYTEPKVIARHNIAPTLFGCSGSDAVGFEVTAKNPQGQPVTLLICSGWIFKAATVRIP